jgi:HEAT repeat protein
MHFLLGNRLHLVLLGTLVLCSSGCANGLTDALPYWPFGNTERTTYLTPAKRIVKLNELAEQASSKSEAERETISGELATQIKQEEDPVIREELVKTISAFPTATTRAVQMAALKDFDPYVRIAACEKLSDTGDPAVAAALAEMVQNDADIDVRLAATDALSKFKDPAVMPALALALDDTDPALQHRAIQSLRATSNGQDYGNDVSAWRQYARGETPTPKPPTSVAEKLRSLSPF